MKLNVLVFAATAVAAPAAKLVVHESRDATTVGYTKGAALDSNTKVPVRIALKQRNLENAMDLLLKVYVSRLYSIHACWGYLMPCTLIDTNPNSQFRPQVLGVR